MSRSKRKGTRYENEVRDALASFDGYRCGEVVGHPGDVRFSVNRVDDAYSGERIEAGPYFIECKRRAKAWAELYRWLDKNENDFLALRADHKRTLVVMDLEQFKALLAGNLPEPRRTNDIQEERQG